MISTLLKKTGQSFNKETVSKATSQPDVAPEPLKATTLPEPKPIDATPRGLAKAAAEAAGFVRGTEYQGQTLRHRPPNKNMVWATVDNWGEHVLYSVQNQLDWAAGERIWGHYAEPDAQGRLLFENRQGIRRKKFRS